MSIEKRDARHRDLDTRGPAVSNRRSGSERAQILAATLKSVRKRTNCSLRRLARILAMDAMNLSDWENGIVYPTSHNLLRWMNTLGLDLAVKKANTPDEPLEDPNERKPDMAPVFLVLSVWSVDTTAKEADTTIAIPISQIVSVSECDFDPSGRIRITLTDGVTYFCEKNFMDLLAVAQQAGVTIIEDTTEE